MNLINFTDLASGYKERMKRLALMDPLTDLANKQTKDEQDHPVDMRGMGMLTLLFFFERKLTREYKTGVKDVTDFLLEMTRETYVFNFEAMEKIVRLIIETFRPPRGRKRTFPFFNWELKETDEIEYSILKANDFDAKTQTQYYTLDEDGLELLFATKEFYAEFQMSINQLLLKQQIKKGEFHQALRQVREMEVEVERLKDNLEKMKAEILRSIVSEEIYERYKQLLDETHARFEREDEEFEALNQFIADTQETFHQDEVKHSEIDSYHLILKVASELEAVHNSHATLISMTIELRTTVLTAAQDSLYFTGIQSFNFNQDIVATLLAKPYSPEKIQGIMQPFLKVEQNPVWSPLTVFAQQSIVEEREQTEAPYYTNYDDEEITEQYRKWQMERYGVIFGLFMQAYENGEARTLKQWMEKLAKEDNTLIHERYFYSFWLLMHHMSPLISSTSVDGESILTLVYQQLMSKHLIVEELPDQIQIAPKYSIQNMSLRLEE